MSCMKNIEFKKKNQNNLFALQVFQCATFCGRPFRTVFIRIPYDANTSILKYPVHVVDIAGSNARVYDGGHGVFCFIKTIRRILYAMATTYFYSKSVDEVVFAPFSSHLFCSFFFITFSGSISRHLRRGRFSRYCEFFSLP